MVFNLVPINQFEGSALLQLYSQESLPQDYPYNIDNARETRNFPLIQKISIDKRRCSL